MDVLLQSPRDKNEEEGDTNTPILSYHKRPTTNDPCPTTTNKQSSKLFSLLSDSHRAVVPPPQDVVGWSTSSSSVSLSLSSSSSSSSASSSWNSSRVNIFKWDDQGGGVEVTECSTCNSSSIMAADGNSTIATTMDEEDYEQQQQHPSRTRTTTTMLQQYPNHGTDQFVYSRKRTTTTGHGKSPQAYRTVKGLLFYDEGSSTTTMSSGASSSCSWDQKEEEEDDSLLKERATLSSSSTTEDELSVSQWIPLSMVQNNNNNNHKHLSEHSQRPSSCCSIAVREDSVPNPSPTTTTTTRTTRSVPSTPCTTNVVTNTTRKQRHAAQRRPMYQNQITHEIDGTTLVVSTPQGNRIHSYSSASSSSTNTSSVSSNKDHQTSSSSETHPNETEDNEPSSPPPCSKSRPSLSVAAQRLAQAAQRNYHQQQQQHQQRQSKRVTLAQQGPWSPRPSFSPKRQARRGPQPPKTVRNTSSLLTAAQTHPQPLISPTRRSTIHDNDDNNNNNNKNTNSSKSNQCISQCSTTAIRSDKNTNPAMVPPVSSPSSPGTTGKKIETSNTTTNVLVQPNMNPARVAAAVKNKGGVPSRTTLSHSAGAIADLKNGCDPPKYGRTILQDTTEDRPSVDVPQNTATKDVAVGKTSFAAPPSLQVQPSLSSDVFDFSQIARQVGLLCQEHAPSNTTNKKMISRSTLPVHSSIQPAKEDDGDLSRSPSRDSESSSYWLKWQTLSETEDTTRPVQQTQEENETGGEQELQPLSLAVPQRSSQGLVHIIVTTDGGGDCIVSEQDATTGEDVISTPKHDERMGNRNKNASEVQPCKGETNYKPLESPLSSQPHSTVTSHIPAMPRQDCVTTNPAEDSMIRNHHHHYSNKSTHDEPRIVVPQSNDTPSSEMPAPHQEMLLLVSSTLSCIMNNQSRRPTANAPLDPSQSHTIPTHGQEGRDETEKKEEDPFSSLSDSDDEDRTLGALDSNDVLSSLSSSSFDSMDHLNRVTPLSFAALKQRQQQRRSRPVRILTMNDDDNATLMSSSSVVVVVDTYLQGPFDFLFSTAFQDAHPTSHLTRSIVFCCW